MMKCECFDFLLIAFVLQHEGFLRLATVGRDPGGVTWEIPKHALLFCRNLKPDVSVPPHFFVAFNGSWPLFAPFDGFGHCSLLLTTHVLLLFAAFGHFFATFGCFWPLLLPPRWPSGYRFQLKGHKRRVSLGAYAAPGFQPPHLGRGPRPALVSFTDRHAGPFGISPDILTLLDRV